MKNYKEIINKLELQRVKFNSVEEKEDHDRTRISYCKTTYILR